jgi:DNA-directed RNA polymerase specialized sigma subunit
MRPDNRFEQYHLDEQYIRYLQQLEPILAEYGENTDSLQEWQVNHLVTLETELRRLLVRHTRGASVYQAFVDQCKNILTARPYFRERDVTFKAHISVALRNKDPIALTRFNFNWTFIEFILRQGGWESERNGRRMLGVVEKIRELRHQLIQCNLPLAISQARIFWGRNKKSHLDLMDFNQIAAVGLSEAVDKYVGPYKKTFRAVVIGRMLGNFIDDNSATFVHFFPNDRKILYRVRKLMRRQPKDAPVDYGSVHRSLNEMETEVGDKLTTQEDMLHILSASNVTTETGLLASTGNTHTKDDDLCSRVIENWADVDANRPDIATEYKQEADILTREISSLPVLEVKVLRLRGVDVDLSASSEA